MKYLSEIVIKTNCQNEMQMPILLSFKCPGMTNIKWKHPVEGNDLLCLGDIEVVAAVVSIHHV